jgi:hypothetical protein
LDADDLEQRVRDFVKREAWLPKGFLIDADLVCDAGIDGADMWELLEKFRDTFGVAFSDFRWYHHTSAEGCNPFWIFFPPWWARKTHIPIRLKDLVESARCGEWKIQYPENEREPTQ